MIENPKIPYLKPNIIVGQLLIRWGMWEKEAGNKNSPDGFKTVRGFIFYAKRLLSGQGVEGRSCFEPINLVIVESMVDLTGVGRSIFMFDRHSNRLSRSQLIQTFKTDPVFCLNLVLVGFIRKREGQDCLLLQIGFKDAGVGIGDKCKASHMTRFHGRMLAAGALAHIFIGKRDPTQA